MKTISKVILFFTFFCISFTLHAGGSYVLQGVIKGKVNGDVKLSYSVFTGNRFVSVENSSSVKSGRFLLKGSITEPVEATLSVNDNEWLVYLEPGVMKIIMDLSRTKDFKLTGSRTHADYERLRSKTRAQDEWLDTYAKQRDEYALELQSISKEKARYQEIARKQAELNTAADSVQYVRHKNTVDFIRSQVHSYYPLLSHTMEVYVSQRILDADSARVFFNRYDQAIKSCSAGIAFDQYLKTIESTKAGNVAPDFSTYDHRGKAIRLSAYRSENYVLLDFWASWCVPCVQGIPHLKKLYATYHDKGLEIISVSCDINKEQWLSAVEKNGLSVWPQVLSVQDIDKFLQGYVNDDDIRSKYPTDGIPRYFLIDKNGKIAGHWFGYSTENDNEQDKMLRDIFGF